MPDGITDRNADVWEALLAVADAAGGPWPNLSRVAAVALVADAKAGSPSLGVRLLTGLRTIFQNQEGMPTAEILSALIDMDEAPWGDLKGKPLDSRRLANLLNPYGVKSKNVRISTSVTKGYTRESLWDAWERYLPALGVPHIESATSVPESDSF
jgi:hypothetical protein